MYTRLLALAIQHDYRRRLRRGFSTWKVPVVGTAAVSAAERRLDDARAWHRGRVRATAFGLWLATVQEAREVGQAALTTGAAMHRRKALGRCCRQWLARGVAAGLARRRAALAACYLATLRTYEGLARLQERCAARTAQRQRTQAALEPAAQWQRRRRLATSLNVWRGACGAVLDAQRRAALAQGLQTRRSSAAALTAWGALVSARTAGAARLAAATRHRRRADLASCLVRWRRMVAVHWRIGRSAQQAADKHFAFVGTYRCCVRVMVKLVSRLKRALLKKRKNAAGTAANRRRLLRNALTQITAFHQQARGHAARGLRADFHRDVRRLAAHLATLRCHRDAQHRARHALLKGVLIWKMSRSLTGFTKWVRWVRRKVARRRMRAAAEAGHAAEVARRACRVVLSASTATGARRRDERRQRLVRTTLAKWRRFVWRRQLARETARQRESLAAAGVAAPGIPAPTRLPARPADAGVQGVQGAVGEEGLGDLARARPRPLAPFLVFRRGGDGGVGGGLTCALGFSPPPVRATAVAAAAAAESPHAGAAVHSSPVSVAGSARILSPHGRDGGVDRPPAAVPDPPGPGPPGLGLGPGSGASVLLGATGARPPPARAPAGGPGPAASVGLARAPPRKPPSLGALLDGILPPPKTTGAEPSH